MLATTPSLLGPPPLVVSPLPMTLGRFLGVEAAVEEDEEVVEGGRGGIFCGPITAVEEVEEEEGLEDFWEEEEDSAASMAALDWGSIS